MLILINTNYVFKNAMCPTVLLWGLLCGLKTLRPLPACTKPFRQRQAALREIFI